MSEAGYQVITQSIVSVRVTSNVNTFGSERRFQKDLTIADLKNKIELLTGASSGTMKLSLNDKDNQMVCQLDNEAALLGSYPVEDNMIIHGVELKGVPDSLDSDDLSSLPLSTYNAITRDVSATVDAFKNRFAVLLGTDDAIFNHDAWPNDLSCFGDDEIQKLLTWFYSRLHRNGCNIEEVPNQWTLFKSMVRNSFQDKSYMDLLQMMMTKSPYKESLKVEDKSLILGEYEDVSKVEKYEMAEEDYSKRSDSVRSFKERNKLGRFDPEEQARKQREMQEKEEEEKIRLAEMKIGDRCEVQITGQPTRRGTVKYLGNTDFKPGLWVGVQYDEPHGKNNGSVKGKQYFSCQPKYGGFVKPLNVKVGDFPEEDFGLSDEEM